MMHPGIIRPRLRLDTHPVLLFLLLLAGLCVLTFRFFAGRPMFVPKNKRATDATFWHRGTKLMPGHEADRLSFWAFMPEWERAAVRTACLVIFYLIVSTWWTGSWVTGTAALVVPFSLSCVAIQRATQAWKFRKVRRTYTNPLARALRQALGINQYLSARRWLTITPELEGLLPELIKPMKPWEVKVRVWYGQHLEPAVRWFPDRVRRALWWLTGHSTATRAWWWRKPSTPHARLRVPGQYVNPDQQKAVTQVVISKLGISELAVNWNQVGPDAIATYVVKQRPPKFVGIAECARAMLECKEWEYVLGLDANKRPVVINLKTDSPHVCCSAGTGAGKSVLAMIIGIQVLRKGGRVVILDKKGSHRWAKDLPGVTYCTRASDMHDVLLGLESLAETRNTKAMDEAEDWNPGERVFVIFEEMNATVAQLKQYWDKIRERTDPKMSPAIQAFRNLMFMGRSAKVNLFGVAQMLTANTTGGPEARENFGVRCLARYTSNNWKMLVPECAMPRKSKVLGRWQVCIGDEAIETQVACATAQEARDWVLWEQELGDRIPAQDARTEPPTVGPRRYTLAEASRQPWCSLGESTLRTRKQRAGDRWPAGINGKWTQEEIMDAIKDKVA